MITLARPVVELFGIRIDAVPFHDAVRQSVDWAEHRDGKFRYVVTPNVQHAVMLQHHTGLQAAYEDASLVVTDGMPVVVASRLLGRPLPGRVNGTELTYGIFAAGQHARPLSVFLLGAGPGVADRAAIQLQRRWPGAKVVGTYSPPFGFEKDPVENRQILDRIAAVSPDVLVVGLGAPKQELWCHTYRNEISAGLGLCVGATIDFLAGEKPLAPRWMGRCGLEWMHRLATEPRRLFKRYASDAVEFPKLMYREWRSPSSATRLVEKNSVTVRS